MDDYLRNLWMILLTLNKSDDLDAMDCLFIDEYYRVTRDKYVEVIR